MSLSPHRIQRLLPQTLTADRPGFQRELSSLRRRFSDLMAEPEKSGAAPGPAPERMLKAYESGLRRLKEKIDESIAKAETRRRRIPAMKYPSDLPITERREEIAELIKSRAPRFESEALTIDEAAKDIKKYMEEARG